ncbi:MAG: YdcH family protein [Myxococcota bacterium]
MNRDVDELRTEHEQLEKRLEALHRPRSMSPEEQSEIAELKKKKLAIKDRLMTLDSP